jgi:hypothetical protein
MRSVFVQNKVDKRCRYDRLILYLNLKEVCKRSFMPKVSITCMKEEIPEVYKDYL